MTDDFTMFENSMTIALTDSVTGGIAVTENSVIAENPAASNWVDVVMPMLIDSVRLPIIINHNLKNTIWA